MRKNTKVIFVIIFFLFIFIFMARRGPRGSESQLSVPVSKGTIIESIYGIGTVTANRTYQFKSGITGTIRELYVQEGDDVKKGDRLLMFDNELILKAPFDGTVTKLPFKVNENVFPQTVVAEVVDLMDRYMVVSLEQRGALCVRKGHKVKLSFDGLREKTFEGVVEVVYSSGNDLLVRVGIAHLPPEILPGMTADAAIGINERNGALLVPVAALNNGQVVVSRNGKKFNFVVKTGIIDGAMAEVLEGGIREGDLLFIRKKVK